MNLKYSANVGFLWDHLSLPGRIVAAAQAGFDAVECHFPYEYASDEINSILKKTKLSMIGINTVLGPQGSEYFGTATIAGKEELTRASIDQAIDYSVAIDASNINVIAGLSKGTKLAESIYVDNLTYACSKAASVGKTIVIEPLSPQAVPDYHFSTVEHAVSIIEAVAADNLKLMLDFFHTQIVQGDLERVMREHISYVGHVQISAVHDRGEPDAGEINYPYILSELDRLGYKGYVGAEYRPRGVSVESGLGWLEAFRNM